jgi:hypothetical protein
MAHSVKLTALLRVQHDLDKLRAFGHAQTSHLIPSGSGRETRIGSERDHVPARRRGALQQRADVELRVCPGCAREFGLSKTGTAGGFVTIANTFKNVSSGVTFTSLIASGGIS